MRRDIKIWGVFLILECLLLGEYFISKSNDFIDLVSIMIALFTVFLLIFELKQNKDISEAQLIIEMNNQFINSPELTRVEQKLEEYFYYYKKGKRKDEVSLDLDLGIKDEDRQSLINYLVHLEGVAALVNNKVLRLPVITDLMAYRYFIAVNNPVVQEVELIPYKSYYQGCYKMYKIWSDKTKDIPLEEYSLLKVNKDND